MLTLRDNPPYTETHQTTHPHICMYPLLSVALRPQNISLWLSNLVGNSQSAWKACLFDRSKQTNKQKIQYIQEMCNTKCTKLRNYALQCIYIYNLNLITFIPLYLQFTFVMYNCFIVRKSMGSKTTLTPFDFNRTDKNTETFIKTSS